MAVSLMKKPLRGYEEGSSGAYVGMSCHSS